MKYFQNSWIMFTIFAILSTSVLCNSNGIELNQTIACLQEYIQTFSSKVKPELFKVFKKAFPNTLSTTIQHYNLTVGYQQTYIITGDIQAMWLRDSTNQFLPYLKIDKQCPHIQSLAKGLINTQAQFIMIDPYTNSFKKFQTNPDQRPFYLKDRTEKLIMGVPVDLCKQRQFATKSIWERKFQIDSLAAFFRITYEYYEKYQDLTFLNINWVSALKRILTTLDEQIQDSAFQKQNRKQFYTFYRDARQLANGTIKPCSRTGMIKTGFRPSDDPNEHAFNIPGNAMMATFLDLVSNKVLSQVPSSSVFYSTIQVQRQKMLNFAQGIRLGISTFGVIDQSVTQGGRVFAYQVDGFGKYSLYDDANLPSLLSLPYLGFVSLNDIVYQNTRKLILSKKNPFFFQRGQLKGVGSSHTQRDYVWPLAIMVEALTSTSEIQISNCLYNLEKSSLHDLVHQSFSVLNPNMISREWFAWANSFFGQLIVTLSKTHPNLIK